MFRSIFNSSLSSLTKFLLFLLFVFNISYIKFDIHYTSQFFKTSSVSINSFDDWLVSFDTFVSLLSVEISIFIYKRIVNII